MALCASYILMLRNIYYKAREKKNRSPKFDVWAKGSDNEYGRFQPLTLQTTQTWTKAFCAAFFCSLALCPCCFFIFASFSAALACDCTFCWPLAMMPAVEKKNAKSHSPYKQYTEMALKFTKYGVYAEMRRTAADRNLVRLVDVRRPADRGKKL